MKVGSITFFLRSIAPTEPTIDYPPPLRQTLMVSLGVLSGGAVADSMCFRISLGGYLALSLRNEPGATYVALGDSHSCASPRERTRCSRRSSARRNLVACCFPPSASCSKGCVSTAAGRSRSRGRGRRSRRQWHNLVVPYVHGRPWGKEAPCLPLVVLAEVPGACCGRGGVQDKERADYLGCLLW